MVIFLWSACVFYSDEDRDRDGDGALAIAFGGQDCEDGNAIIHPEAIETCNGVDDNCNGQIDDSAADARAWFADADGDGFGSDTTTSCEAGLGLVEMDGDCDDGNNVVFPGATEDICTELDEDCDGSGFAASAEPNARLGGETGGTSGIGAALATGQQDGVGEVLVAGSADAGTTLIFALEQATYSDSSERWASVEGGGGLVAFGDAFVGTVDRDDLIIGDAGWDAGRGRVGIFQLAQTGGEHTWDVASKVYEAPNPGDGLGGGITFFQGDDDYSSILMLGAPGTDEGRGAVYIRQLTAGGESGASDVSVGAYGVVTSTDYVVNAGLGLSIGGWADSANSLYGAYGAPGQQGRFGTDTGALAIAQIGTIDILNTSTHVYTGAGGGDRFTHAIASGDIDGDGLDELAVSAPGHDTDGGVAGGAVYILAGTVIESDVAGGVFQHELDSAVVVVEGDVEGRGLGRAIKLDGDVLVASAWLASCDGGDPGAVYVIELGMSGKLVVRDSQRQIVGEPDSGVGDALLITQSGLWVGELAASRVERFPTD